MMHTRRTPLLATLVLLLLAPLALAQDTGTVADLRRENDQLRERVAQLEATLVTLLEQNQVLVDETRALREAVVALRDQVESEDETDTTVPSPGAIVPTDTLQLAEAPNDPMASPALLLEALRRDHEDRFLDIDISEDEGDKRYRAELRRWFRAIERDFTQRVAWELQVESIERLEQERRTGLQARILFRVVDPESGLPFDREPSSLVVEGRVAERVLQFPDTDRWTLTGVCAATPVLNLERTERGMIDTPPFIGPYVEFAFNFRVNALIPELETP